MIPCENIEIFCSLLFYVATQLISFIYNSSQMHGKRTLSSIPERCEEEEKSTKWVPKKKHEVLKAKYKCLKKLFQIYDASVIGALPGGFGTEVFEEETESRPRRKKRSHRTKTDACAGTTEISNGDLSDNGTVNSVATTLIADTKIPSASSVEMSEKSEDKKSEQQQESKVTISNISDRDCECNFTQTMLEKPCMGLHNIQHQMPYLLMNERPRLTRFQSFIQRIFGLKQEKNYRNYMLPNGQVYSASDYCVRRRRRMRFRRLRKAKNVHSEIALRDFGSPTILSFVQSVQRNCLMDTTPRHCPMTGCRMVSYGIINYNDHLNLCHFNDRKFSCHYCHEGFEREYDKYTHENEHIGITKLNNYNYSLTSTANQSGKKASNTQTDPHTEVAEEKLKKIVSFFDKIVDNDLLDRIKKSRYSESNLQTLQQSTRSDYVTEQDTMSNSSSDKRAVSCGNLLNAKMDKFKTVTESDTTSKYSSDAVKCHFCGEDFDYRRQLSLHVDLEHRVHDKYSKFHSCAGISNCKPKPQCIGVENGRLKVHTDAADLRRTMTSSSITNFYHKRGKSEDTLSCDPSTNIIYCESETAKKPSVIDSFVRKVKCASYKWEPGTKIIRV